MVTRRCNMTCAHCSVESSPRIRQQPSEEFLESIVTQAAAAGVRSVLFTGGEPMLCEQLVTRLVRLATRSGMATAITTNGFWGKSASSAFTTLSRLRKAGLKLLTLSYDRYHAEFQGPEPGLNIVKAAESL
jgi:MoaA/NifB/PqqE/SkfB family radical SAM enzyme